MEKIVFTLPENLPQVLIVHGPEMWFGALVDFPQCRHEIADFRRCVVGLTPQVKLGGNLHLSATRLQRLGDGFNIVRLYWILATWTSSLRQILEVLPQNVAQALELLWSRIGPTKLEGLS